MIGAAVLIWLYPRFRFTNLVYTFIALHAIILMIGGHYTYAEIPPFNWLRDMFHQVTQLLRPRRTLRAGLRALPRSRARCCCAPRRCGAANSWCG